MDAKGCDIKGVTAFVAGIIMGTGSTITIKVLYEINSIGIDGQERPFEKPLFTTFIMFLAMALAIPVHWIHQRYLVDREERYVTDYKVLLLLIFPSIFDLIGTALAGVGLLYCAVSVYQLVRCTVIIFTALLKAFVLKDHLLPHMWLGVGINVVAMTMVSLTTFFDDENTPENRDPRLGIMFILLSCLVQGTQYVFEEKVMHVDGAPPLVVVGMEGVWGTLLMLGVVFPLAQYFPGTDPGGCMENFYDSIALLKNSQALQIVTWIFLFTVALYNVFAVFVTKFLSSIWHAILDNFRPVSVWSTDLVIYYFFTQGRFGESWTPYSWLQFAGMMVLFVGTAVYNGSIPTLDLGFLTYKPVDEMERLRIKRRASLDMITPVIRTQENMSSPYLMRSPLMRSPPVRNRDYTHGMAASLTRSGSLQNYGSGARRSFDGGAHNSLPTRVINLDSAGSRY